jgi:hypothetical protein
MIYDAEMQWLEAKQGAKDSAFVTTTFDLASGEKEKAVQFEQASDVQVVGWIQSFRISTEKGEDYACDFWATKVNSKGFTAHADCGGNTERLTVTFIALKKGKDKVAAGSFSTEKDAEEGENSKEMKGRVDFEDGVFDKAPTVLVSEDGFSWVIRKLDLLVAKDTWTDTYQVLGEMMQKTLFTARRLLSLPSATSLNVFDLVGTNMNVKTGIISYNRKLFAPSIFQNHTWPCECHLKLPSTLRPLPPK